MPSLSKHIKGHPDITTKRESFTNARTEQVLVKGRPDTRIVVTQISVHCDNANANDTSVRAGFGEEATPTTTGVILTHPGIAAGRGLAEGDGTAALGIGDVGESLYLTSEDPSGTIDLNVSYFYIGTSPTFQPSDIDGLQLWLRADIRVYTDAGVTLAADGQTVQEWHDRSGGGNNATQTTGTNKPTKRVVGDIHSVEFDGVDNWMGITDIATLGTTLTISMWIKRIGSGSNVFMIDLGANQVYSVSLFTNKVRATVSAGNLFDSTTTITANGWHHVVVIFTPDASGTIKIFIDNTSEGSATGKGTNTPADLTLGSYGVRNAVFLNGRLDDITIYNAELTTDDITNLYNHGLTRHT